MEGMEHGVGVKKSLFVTYFLWLFGGIFGFHHLYLGRDRHAFVFWSTCGGFLFGWMYDFWLIPSYVKDANEDPVYMERLAKLMRTQSKPPTVLKIFCSMIYAEYLAQIALYAIPFSEYKDDERPTYVYCVIPLACAIGVHTIGNIGRAKVNFFHLLLAAYFYYPLYFISPMFATWTPCVVQFIYEISLKQWRRQPYKKRPFFCRMLILMSCGILFLSILGSAIYFNCSVKTDDDQVITCFDAAQYFFKSPIVRESRSFLKQLCQYAYFQGGGEFWRHLFIALDPSEYYNALKVFGFSNVVSEKILTRRYRSLSAQYHPDKFNDPLEKEAAEIQFIKIQEAYEILSKRKASRVVQNVKTCDTDDCDNEHFTNNIPS